MKKRILSIATMCVVALLAFAENDDFGMQFSAEASHKFNKKWSMGIEAEMRMRDNMQTVDRWSGDIGASFKICKYLKLSAGYALLYDHNEEKYNYKTSGTVTKWRPAYWGIRHRFNVSLTGSVELNKFTFSLRERWQYTYRPEKTVDRYDYSDDAWEDKVMQTTNKNILRSRVKIEYGLSKGISPYFSTELYNSLRLQKTRLMLGAEWKINKKNTFEAFYRYQIVNKDDDNEYNTHIIGVGYKFKF